MERRGHCITIAQALQKRGATLQPVSHSLRPLFCHPRIGLVFLAALADWSSQFDYFRQFEAHLFLDDFLQRDVCGAHMTGFGDQGSAGAATAGIELADAA